MPVPVGALAAFGPAIGCDGLRAGAEPLAGADRYADPCPGTDRHGDRDPDPYPYGRAYRCAHPYYGGTHGDAHLNRNGEPDCSAGDRYADANARTDRYAVARAEPHGERHADGDGDPGGPAYGNASACLRGLARGILQQPRSGGAAGLGPHG